MKILRVLAVLCLLALPALSAPVAPTNEWISFGWVGGVGAHGFGGFSDYIGSLGTPVFGTGPGCVPLSAATCMFTGSYTLTVQDLFFDGDQFAVYDNGVLLGNTSASVNTGTDCGNDPAGCTGANVSTGTFVLGAGDHSLDIVLIQQTTGIPNGRGAFIFNGEVAGVPEPATMGLIGLGLVGIAFRLRKRRT